MSKHRIDQRCSGSFRSGQCGKGSLRGFTLTELLVVAGIAGLLGGMLVPVLSAARERGREASCISNLRQVGRAFQMYLDDHELRPPFLHDLSPGYVTDRRLFLCPDDRWVSRG